MRFELKGVQEVRAPADRVWEALLDHEYVASCAPTVESVEMVDDTHFKVVTFLGVGSVKLRFTLQVALEDLEPPTRARMKISGNAPGSAARADATATLAASTESSTELSWTVGADVHGTIAGTGARLLKGTAQKLTAAFWKKFAAGLAAKPSAKAATPPARRGAARGK